MDEARRGELKRLAIQMMAQFPDERDDQDYLLNLIRQLVEDFPQRFDGERSC